MYLICIVQRFKPKGRRFINSLYYHYYQNNLSEQNPSPPFFAVDWDWGGGGERLTPGLKAWKWKRPVWLDARRGGQSKLVWQRLIVHKIIDRYHRYTKAVLASCSH